MSLMIRPKVRRQGLPRSTPSSRRRMQRVWKGNCPDVTSPQDELARMAHISDSVAHLLRADGRIEHTEGKAPSLTAFQFIEVPTDLLEDQVGEPIAAACSDRLKFMAMTVTSSQLRRTSMTESQSAPRRSPAHARWPVAVRVDSHGSQSPASRPARLVQSQVFEDGVSRLDKNCGLILLVVHPQNLQLLASFGSQPRRQRRTVLAFYTLLERIHDRRMPRCCFPPLRHHFHKPARGPGIRDHYRTASVSE